MGESKIKHAIGFIHSMLWVCACFRKDEMLNTNILLRISIAYYIQDIIWSLHMKQYFIVLHHICVSIFWYFLIRDEPVSLYDETFLLYAPMFLAEISAACIHLKHIIETPITHHICMISFVMTRLVLFPTLVLPYHYQIMMQDNVPTSSIFLLGGFVLNVFVVLLSVATIITKWNTFRRSLLLCLCIRKKVD